MRIILIAILTGLVLLQPAFAEIGSLSHLFAPGKAVHDRDGDGLPETLAVSIVIPDRPTAYEVALAADIAARANFESLAVDFGLVRRESEVGDWTKLPSPILIGSSLSWTREILQRQKIDPTSLGPNRGIVVAFSHKGQRGILCAAGSDEALLRTGRAFFLRWPYFWEIWGRDMGATFLSLEDDLSRFLSGEKLDLQKTVIREALYEFPLKPSVSNALQSLAFDEGQVRNLTVEVHFPDAGDRDRARDALESLRRGHEKGLRTGVLTYPGCARLTVELRYGESVAKVGLPRVGSTKRLLTPGFKPRPGAEPAGKEFDLTTLFSTKGFYSDQDRDGIPDGLDSAVIASSEAGAIREIADLTSRLVLGTAGGSFPVAYLDAEIESRKSLSAPILVGANDLTRELVRTGQLKPRDPGPARGSIWIVPKAFGKSSALVIDGSDATGLGKTISFFARRFPYFDGFGEGRAAVADVVSDCESFLEGGKGGAEAYFVGRLENALQDIKGKDLEFLEAQILLPGPNEAFSAEVERRMKNIGGTAPVKVEGTALRSGQPVFQKETVFTWEVDEALSLVEEKIKEMKSFPRGAQPMKISLGVSESPRVREKTRARIEDLLQRAGVSSFEVEVLSAYKPGFFWLTEKILPVLKTKDVARILVRFKEEREDITRPKRSYSEPARWLQELYPADEIISRETGLPLERIEFEIKDIAEPTYEVLALDADGKVLVEQRFSPRVREIRFLDALPEWGTVRVTTGWLRMETGKTLLFDRDIRTDLERFWSFYQEEALRPAYAHVLKKTGQEPTFSKQPYFKRLLVELRLSEPDYKLGLDEEIISSLEAMHDEIYFSTLDFMRGITRFDPEDKELPADASRSSAPGNVTPLIYPSLEGEAGRAKVLLEDWPGQAPQLLLKWKEKDRDEVTKKIAFPKLKPKSLQAPGLIFDGREERVETLFLEMEWEKEQDYAAMLDIFEAHRLLSGKGLVADPFSYPRLRGITVRLKCQDREKEEGLTVAHQAPKKTIPPPPPAAGEAIVTTRDIIPPELCSDLVARLGRFETVRSYVGGKSYEGRDVPVIEMYLPLAEYVSLPRLVTFKPTLQLTGRQHANEVSATNYLLRFTELVAGNDDYREALKKMNIVLQPMENPDGAELAYELHKIEPFHSLHAGRYGALGVDIGYQGGGSRPLLPEAAVRTNLYNRWLPDIFLNLHGYPSHEWVQPFSNYTPYLFRDYWIPKGWFTYFRTLSLPIYEKWRKAGEELMACIIAELQADGRIKESNRKFYDRYERWAGRWAPHMNALEIYDGVNIFAKRRSSSENKLSQRTQTTFVEQTPEIMDETATGDWLEFLCDQGLAYLRAHVAYLSRARYDVVRLEEESRDRVRISFLRGRPGSAAAAEER